MKTITGYKEAAKIIGSFHFHEFCILRELRYYFELEQESVVAIVDLVMESKNRVPNYRLNYRFKGVTNLYININGLGGGLEIEGFDIVDISDRQLEGLSWQIIDFENREIDFHCKSTEIMSFLEINS